MLISNQAKNIYIYIYHHRSYANLKPSQNPAPIQTHSPQPIQTHAATWPMIHRSTYPNPSPDPQNLETTTTAPQQNSLDTDHKPQEHGSQPTASTSYQRGGPTTSTKWESERRRSKSQREGDEILSWGKRVKKESDSNIEERERIKGIKKTNTIVYIKASTVGFSNAKL